MRLVDVTDVGVSDEELAQRDRDELAARLQVREAAQQWATTTRRAQGLPEQLVLELFNDSNAESALPSQTPRLT